MKIRNKTRLRKVLHSGNFDKIAFWGNGSWVDVDSGYNGEQNGYNPVAFISRKYLYEPTHAMITEELKKIEEIVIFRGKRYSSCKEAAEELFKMGESINMVDDNFWGWEVVKDNNILRLIRYEGVEPMAGAGPYRGPCLLKKRIVAEQEVA